MSEEETPRLRAVPDPPDAPSEQEREPAHKPPPPSPEADRADVERGVEKLDRILPH
jgi:hypothetical protein